MTDRLIRITTALAVVAVALVAAVISYQHAFELVRSHGESGMTAPSARATKRATVSAPSPANSTSTAVRSSASSTEPHDSADGPRALSQYVTAG